MRMAKRHMTVTAILMTIKATKNRLHLVLVVTRMSIMEMEIFAATSADGVRLKATQRSFMAIDT